MGEGEGEGVGDGDGVGDGVRVGEGDGDGDGVGVGEGDGVGARLFDHESNTDPSARIACNVSCVEEMVRYVRWNTDAEYAVNELVPLAYSDRPPPPLTT